VPTTKPRYTFTDTGDLERMLDVAQRAWPEIDDRKRLLYRLAQTGEQALSDEIQLRDSELLRQRQREALARASEAVDLELLLGDAAWR
jgi:hypothetical protein